MIGPVAALATAISTVALLAAQNKSARTKTAAQEVVRVVRGRAEAEAKAERKAKRRAKRKRQIKEAVEDIVDAADIAIHSVKLKGSKKAAKPPAPPAPGKKRKKSKTKKSARIKVKPNTVIKVLNALGASLKLDNRFNGSDKTTYNRTAKRFGLKIRKTTSQGKGKTALLDPSSTWRKLKAKAASKPSHTGKTPQTSKQPQPLKTREAAERLYVYVVERIRTGRAATLGDKSGPNVQVREYQAAMGKIKADGVYGPTTRKRGKELLGREFPARAGKRAALPAPPPMDGASTTTTEPDELPAQERGLVLAEERSPQEAASDLYDYATRVLAEGKGSLLGVKDRPSATVRDAQADMGDDDADGFYGPATRALGKKLLGRTFPVRR